MFFNRFDQDEESFAGGDPLAPVYKPPPSSDIFFPFPYNFTTPPSSSRFVPYPSDKSSSNFFRYDASTTSNYHHPLSAPCVGQHQQQQHYVYDNLYPTAANMSSMMTAPLLGHVTEQAVRNYLEEKVAEHKHARRLGFNPGSFDFPPELQIRFLGRLVEQEIQSVIPLFAQEPIAQEPIVYEPLAQGLQDNGVFDSVYPDPTVDNFTLFANQTADMALPAEMPKVEQVPPQQFDFVAQTANMDFNTEIPKVEQAQVPIQHAHVEAAHNDVDAEGEPADLQVPTGLKEATVPTETYEALAYLSQLPIDQLTHVMRTLQHNLRVKQEGLLTNQTGMMADQEMDIDEPEQLDDSDDTLPEEPETPKPTREYHVRKEIYDIPPPDHTQDSRDRYLVTCRQKGFTYKEIMKAGGFTEKEPTLRGKFRALTKPAFQRVRKPKWTQRDCDLLRALTIRWHGNNNTIPGSVRPLWGQIAQEMIQYGASYPFGAGTCSRKWRSLQQQP